MLVTGIQRDMCVCVRACVWAANLFFATSSHAVIIKFDGLRLRVRVKFSLGVRVSGVIRATVGVKVMVRVIFFFQVSNLLWSD